VHRTSFLKMQAFRDTYLMSGGLMSGGMSGHTPGRAADEPMRVLDLGAMAYAAQDSYRPLFEGPRFEYVGLDVVAGPNVDVVVADPHCWTEVPSASFDVVVSGQALEHDAQFWVTLAEISRVLRPGGWTCLIAPSNGPVHRYPVDCWRFYPDAGPAMMAWAGLQSVESLVESKTAGKGKGIEWQDMMAIGRKPDMDPAQHARDLERLASIVALRCPTPEPPMTRATGPAGVRYEENARVPLSQRRPFVVRAWTARKRFEVWSRLSPTTQARIESVRNRRRARRT
jgi:SAM-dependent methyltransferase